MADLREHVDGNYALPQPSGPRRVLVPFPDAPTALVVEQDFVMLARHFGPRHVAPLDQPLAPAVRPRNEPFFLVEQTDPAPQEPGFIRFTRRWANLPPDRLEPETYTLSPDVTGDDIAEIEASTEFVWAASGADPTPLDVMGSAPVGATDLRVEPQRWAGANVVWKLFYKLRINRTKSAAAGTWIVEPANLPSQTILSWVRVRYFHTADPKSIEIIQVDSAAGVIEPSALARWKGNIWERRTRYKTAS